MPRGKPRNRAEKRTRWEPLRLATPSNLEVYAKYGIQPPDRCYVNNLYSVFVIDFEEDSTHISFHRHNRAAVRDWRHFQAIKNEVVGPERLAVEVFPPESLLVDSANEYHLWVFPPEWEKFPYLLPGAYVASREESEKLLGPSKARQREWQPGIPTGKGLAKI